MTYLYFVLPRLWLEQVGIYWCHFLNKEHYKRHTPGRKTMKFFFHLKFQHDVQGYIFIGIVCFIGGNFSEENFGLAISFRGMLTLGYN